MKKIILCFLIFCIFYPFANSQTTLENARNARTVANQLYLKILSENAIDFTIEKLAGSAKTLEAVNYFQVRDKEFRVYTGFINPLQYRLTTSYTEIDDELSKSTDTYVNTVSGLLTFLPPPASPPAARPAPPSPVFSLDDLLIAELYIAIRDYNQRFFITQDGKSLIDTLKTIKINADYKDIAAKIKSAFQNLQSANSFNDKDQAIINNKKLLEEIEKSLDKLENKVNNLQIVVGGLKPDTSTSSQDSVFDASEISIIKFKAETIKKQVAEMKEKTQNLVQKYRSIEALFNDDRLNVPLEMLKIVDLTNISTQKRVEVKVILEKMKFNIDDYSLTASEKKEFIIHVRRRQLFIATVSSGIFYSDLKFNRFGTGQDPATGQTIVTKSEELANPLLLAAHLNFYYNTTDDLNWVLQLGVGPSKEKPVLFAGTGIIYKNLQVTFGAIWTWQPGLSALKEGQTVSGSTEINNDIKFTFYNKPHFYVGLSTPFTK